MIDFSNVDLLSVLPENLKQPQTRALSAAVAEGLRILQCYSQAVSLYAAIEELPDEVLNLLAVELRTQYYDQNSNREIREQMVKKTIAWYLRGGTGSVLTEYLGTLYQGGTLEEWYAYGGDPFYFKAIVDLALDDEIQVGDGDRIIERIEAYKNVRSWLEALTFRIQAKYDVPIHYENAIHFQTEFYPRYNLPFLSLDNTWVLDGSRRLNGYDSDESLDFYPVSLHIQAGGASCEPRAETTGLRITAGVHEEVRTEERMKFQTEAAEDIRTEERVKIQTDASYQVKNAAYMTKLNLMDAAWVLDGSRKLDGGRYEL